MANKMSSRDSEKPCRKCKKVLGACPNKCLESLHAISGGIRKSKGSAVTPDERPKRRFTTSIQRTALAMQKLRRRKHFKRTRLDAAARDVAVEYGDHVDEDLTFAIPDNVVDAQIRIGHIRVCGEDSDGETLYKVTPRAKRKLDDALDSIEQEVEGLRGVLRDQRMKKLVPLAFADRVSPTGKWNLADIGRELDDLDGSRNAARKRTSQGIQTSESSIQFIGNDPENPMDVDNFVPSSTQDPPSEPVVQTTSFTSLEGSTLIPSSIYPTPSPSNASPGESSRLATPPPSSPTPQPSGFGGTTPSLWLDTNTQLPMPGGFPVTPSPTPGQLVYQLDSALAETNTFNGALAKEIEEFKSQLAFLRSAVWTFLCSAVRWKLNFERSQNEHAETKKTLSDCEARKMELEREKSQLETDVTKLQTKYDKLSAWYADQQTKAMELAQQQMNLLSRPVDLTAI
ncbi:hypothetical protein BD410DRAFT_279414 [Rickenella mellea]|uniref:Uncharacterized protein n=1 Tax=Rickenella mellea TaxID=50990 RepID=A0A4Y7Q3F2_9AGAM|nr:hypothetical protein BD410DRAFT_279414 [Rickenella mellea]